MSDRIDCNCFRWVPGGGHEFDCPNNTQRDAARLNRTIDVIHELRAQLAACAAGPWRYDVENAPFGEWVMTRDAGPFSEWRKGKRDGNVWTGADYNPIDTPFAFAFAFTVPNPPQVKP